jgi:hypothetical protein
MIFGLKVIFKLISLKSSNRSHISLYINILFYLPGSGFRIGDKVPGSFK